MSQIEVQAGQQIEQHAEEQKQSIPGVRTSDMAALPNLGVPELTAPPQAPATASPPATAQSRNLATLEVEIGKELTEALSDDQRRIEHYRNAGKLFKEAKAQAKREGTTFAEWFASKKFPYSMRTAEYWMELETYWGVVAPMIRETNLGSDINYKKLIKEAKKIARDQARKGEPPTTPPKAKEPWKPTLSNRLKEKLTALRTKHKELSTVQAVFNFLKDIGLTQKQWRAIEQ